MTPSSLPRLAVALLRWFGPEDDAIAGDLAKGFHRRSSSKLWYWWQVGIAIRVAVVREVFRHPVAVAATLTAGWISGRLLGEYVAVTVIDSAARAYSRWRFGYGVPYLGPFFPFISVALPMASEALGSIVAVRLYKGRRPVLLLMYAATVVVRSLGWLALDVVYYDPTMSPPRYVVSVQTLNMGKVLYVLGAPSTAALVGGLWAMSRRRTPT